MTIFDSFKLRNWSGSPLLESDSDKANDARILTAEVNIIIDFAKLILHLTNMVTKVRQMKVSKINSENPVRAR